jgi:hypothetical protein
VTTILYFPMLTLHSKKHTTKTLSFVLILRDFQCKRQSENINFHMPIIWYTTSRISAPMVENPRLGRSSLFTGREYQIREACLTALSQYKVSQLYTKLLSMITRNGCDYELAKAKLIYGFGSWTRSSETLQCRVQ